MPRLFTAIEIPEAVRMHLALVRAPLGGAKWIEPENMHITLRFAGDIDGRTADEFVSFLAGVRARPFPVTIAGVGAFGGRDPRVLWAGVEAGGPLDALHRANDRAARAAGLGSEGRAFKPHVTLARMRGGRQQAVARFLTENGGLHTQPFTATRFVLLSARPGSGGGPYVVEAAFPFEGTAGLDDAEEFADDPPAIEQGGGRYVSLAGTYSPNLDLAEADRMIDHIDLVYRSESSGGHAKMTVYGQR